MDVPNITQIIEDLLKQYTVGSLANYQVELSFDTNYHIIFFAFDLMQT
jgi:hypothetical protein